MIFKEFYEVTEVFIFYGWILRSGPWREIRTMTYRLDWTLGNAGYAGNELK